MLNDYLDLHDLLHDLEFQCYNYIAHQVDRFPEDKLALETVQDHALTFKEIVTRLQAVKARPTVSDNLTWIDELVKAEALLQQALEARDATALKRWCRLVKRVLDRYPSQTTRAVNSAARSLRMEAIEQAMATILTMLRNYGVASEELRTFEAGCASLAELNQRLTSLVRDHDRWQDVDVELRRVEAVLASDPEELELSWPEIKAWALPLVSNEDETALVKESARLDDALAARDTAKARQHFMRFRRQAAERLYKVLVELRDLCSRLRTLGAWLAAVAQLVAEMPLSQSVESSATALDRRKYRQRLLAELSQKYDALTELIAALDTDIDHTLDSEMRLVLERRRDELVAERDELVAMRSQIEDQLKDERELIAQEQAHVVDAPDLQLLITLAPDGKTLSYTLNSPDGDYNFLQLGSVTLQVSPRELLQRTFDRLSTLAVLSPGTRTLARAQQAQRDLADIGSNLYDELLPDVFKTEYRTLREEIPGLQPVADIQRTVDPLGDRAAGRVRPRGRSALR